MTLEGAWIYVASTFSPEGVAASKARSSLPSDSAFEEGSPQAAAQIKRFIDLEKPVERETPERRLDAMRKARAQMPTFKTPTVD